MTNKNDEKIENFILHFRKRIREIEKMKIEGESEPADLYKKIIYYTIFDSLSKCIPKKRNRDRILSFIVKFSEWGNSDRISLPHLSRYLSKFPKSSFPELRQYVTEQLRSWDSNPFPLRISLEKDPSLKDIEGYCHFKKNNNKILTDIRHLRHIHLFYNLRNSLIHESRELGRGSNFNDNYPFPYYIKCEQIGQKEKTWELVYPVKFFEDILEKSLLNLETFLKDNKINPYESYSFGSYWNKR